MLTNFQIHPVSFIKAMSKALELSSNGISKHHRRTAIISRYIGMKLGINQNQLQVLIYASLLHDIGAAANWDEKHFIVHTDNDNLVFNHAEAGYRILKESARLGILAEPIRYHHDRFCGGNPSGFVGTEIPLLSRIIHVADRIEVQIDDSQHIFRQRDKIISDLQENAFFDPEIIKVIRDMSKIDAFWLDIVNIDYVNNFINTLSFFEKLLFDLNDMISIAEIFAKVVDATSPFTATHSKNVAKVCKELARIIGFSEQEVDQFYLAGLLHDLGKLAIPNKILDKRGRLDNDEYEIVKQHPYYSYRIMEEVDGFQTIASWAGTHHERLDGSGYPFKLASAQISFGSRMLAVADIYCALIEARPYRDGMTIEEALEVINEMVLEMKIDANIVDVLRQNAKLLYTLIARKELIS
ncbi:Cyclic di-GMP phosphodiesterase response regulator RpfG [Sporomusa ovata DSM 2662]|uniref:Response regulator/sensory box/HDIG domain protein n=1 Tax=Sporomusa ovata TaxID=2378 RepID=A0A0U1L6H6_9FIRM|nr:HD domain-containing phosphohydrolase [Sporomusa ovata]EQB24768.1 cyclic di-GMP phosphodiesterase response regulator RpfG [Sporomusa ovata DSM 2662]CQR75115.1 Response regulator/sensory box/HDIG domain protein [Sporomusa ovata]